MCLLLYNRRQVMGFLDYLCTRLHANSCTVSRLHTICSINSNQRGRNCHLLRRIRAGGPILPSIPARTLQTLLVSICSFPTRNNRCRSGCYCHSQNSVYNSTNNNTNKRKKMPFMLQYYHCRRRHHQSYLVEYVELVCAACMCVCVHAYVRPRELLTTGIILSFDVLTVRNFFLNIQLQRISPHCDVCALWAVMKRISTSIHRTN